MKLYIPEQAEATADDFPSHPRKVKKWLAALPQANMGEMTRQIFSALRKLNRQKMSNRDRLEIMEMLREPSRDIFNNLKKYFINRTLPLPDKSKKIVNLNQALLQEMAHGYKIIAYEAGNRIDEKIDAKTQAIVICRAIKYHSELILRASEIYAQVPAGIWYDMHQLYAYAEPKGLNKTQVSDREHPAGKTSIEDTYKQVLLFSLARPTALRQSDSDRVYKKLYEWASQTDIGKQAEQGQVNRLFCCRPEEDRPPSYLTQQDCEAGKDVYTLDSSRLVDNLHKLIAAAEQKQDTITVGDEISPDTLKALATSWGVFPKRRFSRAGKQGHIAVAIGLAPAAKMIREGNRPTKEDENLQSSLESGADNFTLEFIPEDMKAMSDSTSGYMTHTEIGKSSNDAWDMVARGKVMTEAFDRQRQLLDKDTIRVKEDDDMHWEVVNISAGGYCLRWNSDSTSNAQIGELIALREREPDGSYEWRIGAIRWMQFTRENGLEIGVQVLSPKVIASEVQRLTRLNEQPFESLMVPGIKPLKQPATILLPAHAFKTGDKLRVKVFEQNMDIKLGTKREHTGSFTQFQFSNVDQAMRAQALKKNKESSKNKDEFDEIWSSL